MILVIVYVGAVAVLFLFVVMMLNIDFLQLRSGFVRYLPIGALVGLILLAELILVIGSWVVSPGASPSAGSRIRHRRRSPDQHPGARRHSLYALPVRVSGGGTDSAGRDGRGDRADLAPSRRCAAAIDLGPARPHPRPVGRGRQGSGRAAAADGDRPFALPDGRRDPVHARRSSASFSTART